jgi:tRNA(adenine34) deaminase
MRHERYMRRCVELARDALAADEVPVGAIVVQGDHVVGKGSESTARLLDASAHAEVMAIREACRTLGSRTLPGVTLYSTVEPCVLCAYVARVTGVSHVVFGIPAGRLGGCTSTYALLMDDAVPGWSPPPTSVSGMLAAECEHLMAEHAQRSSGGSTGRRS